MKKRTTRVAEEGRQASIAVDVRVRVYPGTDAEDCGVVVEDFDGESGQGVDVGTVHIADPARRWAVLLDGGTLVFVDSDALVAE